MINFFVDGTRVKIQINPNLSDKKVLNAYWECGQAWYAELLAQQLEREIERRIENVRKIEYNAGWKDAKAKKRAKRDWFWNTLYEGNP